MRLLIAGLGYTGRAIAVAALAAGFDVVAAARRTIPAEGVRLIRFDHLPQAVADVSHIVVTVPPGDAGDPTLRAAGKAIAAARHLRWIGYLSTTGVYGDRGGGWVDETAPPAPGSARTRHRLAAETAWRVLAGDRAVDIFRIAGIYGPGRSVLDDLRAGTARHIIAPGHALGRIHRDDIARAVVTAMKRSALSEVGVRVSHPGVQVLNLVDDEPAPSADVLAEAARLLGLPLPPARTLDEVWPAMSPMARSFWSENRRVSAAITKATLGIAWRYPTYREGLRAILAAEAAISPPPPSPS